MKIGILTHSLGTNYGGILQNFALQKKLIELGYSPVTFNYITKTPLKIKILSMTKRFIKCLCGKTVPLRGWPTESEEYIISQFTRIFINKHIYVTPKFELKNLGKIDISNYGAIVVGSDQVWRGNNKYIEKFFFSDFVNSKIPKVAYAASMGVDWWSLTEKETKICSQLTKLFSAISVREDNAVNLCKEHLGVNAKLVLDPTLLIDKTYYEKVVEEASIPHREDRSMMVYVLDRDEYKQTIITTIAGKLKLAPHEVMAESSFRNAGRKNIDKCIMPPVEKWIRGFMDADFVVTDSFHGTVFSIIFEKPFVTIINKRRGAGRFTSLLKMLNLEERIIDSTDDALRIISRPIDYKEVQKILSKKRNESIEFLSDNLR